MGASSATGGSKPGSVHDLLAKARYPYPGSEDNLGGAGAKVGKDGEGE